MSGEEITFKEEIICFHDDHVLDDLYGPKEALQEVQISEVSQ